MFPPGPVSYRHLEGSANTKSVPREWRALLVQPLLGNRDRGICTVRHHIDIVCLDD